MHSSLQIPSFLGTVLVQSQSLRFIALPAYCYFDEVAGHRQAA